MPVLVWAAAALFVAGACSECRAFSERRVLDLNVQPLDIAPRATGPIDRALGADSSLRRNLARGDLPELSIKAGALGLSLRQEGNKIRPDVFYDVSGWRLRTRLMSGDSALEIEGMLLRAAHALPLFGEDVGTADLP